MLEGMVAALPAWGDDEDEDKMETDDLSDGDEGEGADKNDGGGLGREEYACGTYELPVPRKGLLSPAFLSKDNHISRRKIAQLLHDALFLVILVD